MKALDVAGEKYSRLLAIRRVESPNRRTRWLFKCDCGSEFVSVLDAVRDGRTTSCGCLKNDLLVARSVTHGHSVNRRESRELKAYNHAKARCFNPNDEKYQYYGGRGITMCDRWRDDAAAFISDMGPCPPGHTIERKDPHGNYEPSNCEWATTRQQARTRTDNVHVTYQGSTMILKDYAALLGIGYKALHARLKYKGQTAEEATLALLSR